MEYHGKLNISENAFKKLMGLDYKAGWMFDAEKNIAKNTIDVTSSHDFNKRTFSFNYEHILQACGGIELPKIDTIKGIEKKKNMDSFDIIFEMDAPHSLLTEKKPWPPEEPPLIGSLQVDDETGKMIFIQ